ncbi:CHC2 zinc finger domain-containing protein [Zhengella mangrovi]|nr:CHC2 zinc finger domain-containing protein [Zhengella mangrovi]
MPFVDFAALKQRVRIEGVLPDLGLEMKQSGGQWRGPCPACRSGGPRALVVTPAKSAFYCFGGRTGGDVIALVSHIRGLSMKAAAEDLSRRTGEGSGSQDENGGNAGGLTVPRERTKEAVRSLQPLTYLEVEHEAVQALGLSPQTCTDFGAGYAPKGIMRGRLTIPVHDRSGTLVAYCGQTVKAESPALIFPNGFKPWDIIFNAHALEALPSGEEGELFLARDPLEVMLAAENGITNVVSFLTDSIRPEQLEMLSGLMDTLGCEHLHMA